MEEGDKAVTSLRAAEVVMAGLFLVFGAVVMWDSQRLGAAWGSDGPQAGYFPFYIGLFIVIASGANLLQAFRMGEKGAHAFELRLLAQEGEDAAAAGPFREFTPNFGPGPPSPANLQVAQDMGKYVNSFAWRGDPPR